MSATSTIDDAGAIALLTDLVSIQSLSGQEQAASRLVDLDVPFFNPYFDKWNFPLYVDVRATGASDVRLSWLLFEPDPVAIYSRVGIWAVGIALLTVAFAFNRIHSQSQERA